MAACGAAMGLWPEAQDAALLPEAKVARTQRHWAGPEARLIVFDNCDGGAGQDAPATPGERRSAAASPKGET